MRKTQPTTVDYAGKQELTLGVIEKWMPGERNRDPLVVEANLAALRKEVCPEHPWALHWNAVDKVFTGWTHYRAHWARGNYLRKIGDRPAVMFLCPLGHTWKKVLILV